MDPIGRYLRETPLLAKLTTQNGWIDSATLTYRVDRREGNAVSVSVHFEEILMEGAGCIAGRRGCYGQLRLELGGDGSVRDARIA